VRRALFANAASTLLAGVVVAMLVALVTSDRMDSAAGAAAAAGIYLMMTRLDSLVGGMASLYEAAVFLDDFHDFIALGRRQDHARSAPLPDPFSCLEAKELVFQYPGAAGPALRGVNLTIRQGEIVALVGENGSGKTTLAKLLAQLYRPSAGRILWDGVDMATVSLETARDHVAVIFQDFIRYPLSAHDNVALGRIGRANDRAAAVAASRRAGADAFLAGLPNAYDTILSKEFVGGAELSVGQWQRVALARALFRDAPFLILDEPTASLDPRAEQALFDSLREVCAGRSVLLISHRFSTVRTADRVYVMKDGRIVEHGSHEQLMADDGLYSELFTLQASAYLDA
jgi:ATP-binding cassette subfamily B protein